MVIPGSSTDLTPSVIGYYDRLSGSFNTDKLIGEVVSRKSPEKSTDDIKLNNLREQSPKPKLIVSKIPTKPINQSLSKSLPKYSNSSIPAAKTLQIISPNVHRMISSHQTTTETITSNPTSKSQFKNGNGLLVSNKRLSDKNNINLPTTRRIFLNKPTKPTGIAIPLTKNLSKISQSIDTISEPIVHTITDNNCNNDDLYKSRELIIDSDKTPTNCDHNFNYDSKSFDYGDDDDDDIQKVLNKTSELINNLLSGNNDSKSKSMNVCDNNSSDKQQEVSMKNSKNLNKYQLQVNSDTDDDEDTTKTNLKLTKSLDNVTETDAKKLPTSSPKLTYSRAKLLTHQQQSQETLAPTPTQPTEQSNTSPSTKHRPLSAASISSSSSSTSTASSTNSYGNEHMSSGGKLVGGITYLASIESLADHSENEVNPSLTMCERAALEIVDSEKSYVEDLGQIIKG